MAAVKAANKGKEVTRAGLAEVFGVALPTVDGWIRDGCPYEERGGRGKEWRFNTAKVGKWLRDRAVEHATGENQTDEAELRRRKLAAETALAELNLAKARSLVADITQAERMVARAFAGVAANMRNLPSRAVPQLIGETDERRFKSVLLAEIDQILEVTANTDLAGEDEEADAEESPQGES